MFQANLALSFKPTATAEIPQKYRTSPLNPFTHACTAIIEFLLFFKVIGKRPSPLAIFMFIALQFQL